MRCSTGATRSSSKKEVRTDGGVTGQGFPARRDADRLVEDHRHPRFHRLLPPSSNSYGGLQSGLFGAASGGGAVAVAASADGRGGGRGAAGAVTGTAGVRGAGAGRSSTRVDTATSGAVRTEPTGLAEVESDGGAVATVGWGAHA